MGLPHATVQLADSVLAPPAPVLAASMWRGKAYAAAARGDGREPRGRGPVDGVQRRLDGPLNGYGLLATGVVLGALEAAPAAARRPERVPE